MLQKVDPLQLALTASEQVMGNSAVSTAKAEHVNALKHQRALVNFAVLTPLYPVGDLAQLLGDIQKIPDRQHM